MAKSMKVGPGGGRYVDGFVIPVPKDKIDAYRRMSRMAGKVWREHGPWSTASASATTWTCRWGRRSRKMAKAKPDETVVFSWIVFKSRAHRDRVNAKVMKDPRLADSMDPKSMPFDAKRMAYGGFKIIIDV